ncbi:MAG TPA: hypothetical protein PL117_03195 [Accumulibacter sp.]|uniref:hypothetical protein n=1 Tax=Accumulibacter sp. TaxID=2053492 RepID=UPI002CD4D2F0|nr:hypothetical protein [Accumulibacter sp.]HRF71753.1 hypothetical protein [Accumulibacter sp.]
MARKQVPAVKPAEEQTIMTEPTETIEEAIPGEPTVPAVEEAPADPEPVVIVANENFIDSLTGRGFRVGETVEGWDIERGQAYARRGLVRLVGPSLTSETGPSEVA